MSRGYGYLVRALNEFASLTAQCSVINAARPVPIRAKASKQARGRQRSQGKSSATARTRKYNADW
jgi:hypothetical protein